jgi:phosphate transport system substrate-binding protein
MIRSIFNSQMLTALVLFGALTFCCQRAQAAQPAATIQGAGASFPYPVYARWASDYHKQSGVKLNYQSIGSGGGIAQIKAKTVDFGASDAPLEEKELVEGGLVQWPMIMGGVVLVVNLPGVASGGLKLSPNVLADMFLGKIKRWNDKAIAADNPGVKLPDTNITVVHRADGSGTTWIFTNYLDKVSPEWKKTVGTAKAVAWPAGVGGKGNEGVTAYVQRIKGAIGYVEYAYALQNKLAIARLKNRAGKFVSPDMQTFQAAAANADWKHAPGFYLVLTDQPGEDSWPITGASFILFHKEQADPAKAKRVLDFFAWCFENGSLEAETLHYVPMPKPVVDLVKARWTSAIRARGQVVWQ